MKNQSLRLGLPQEKGRRGSIQAGHPRLGSAASHHGTTPAWPQPSDADVPLPASVSPFLHLSPGLLEHVGHAAQRGLHFSSSPKAQLSHKTFGGSLVRQVSAWLPAEAELTPPLTSCLTWVKSEQGWEVSEISRVPDELLGWDGLCSSSPWLLGTDWPCFRQQRVLVR